MSELNIEKRASMLHTKKGKVDIVCLVPEVANPQLNVHQNWQRFSMVSMDWGTTHWFLPNMRFRTKVCRLSFPLSMKVLRHAMQCNIRDVVPEKTGLYGKVSKRRTPPPHPKLKLCCGNHCGYHSYKHEDLNEGGRVSF